MVDHGRQKHLFAALFQDVGAGAGSQNSGGFDLNPAAVAAEAAAALSAPAGVDSAGAKHVS